MLQVEIGAFGFFFISFVHLSILKNTDIKIKYLNIELITINKTKTKEKPKLKKNKNKTVFIL